MTTDKKPKNTLADDEKATQVSEAETDEQRRQDKIHLSQLHTNCFASAATAINKLHGHGHALDTVEIMGVLMSSASAIKDGNLLEVEQMLITQAKALEYVFYDALTQLPSLNMINQIQIFSEIAFKAQSQCRKTLAVLAELKHPRRTTFIKQQNNAVNQQINQVAQGSKIENNKKLKNKVVSEVKLEKMDQRGTLEAVPTNKTAETVPLFDGASQPRRKGKSKS